MAMMLWTNSPPEFWSTRSWPVRPKPDNQSSSMVRPPVQSQSDLEWSNSQDRTKEIADRWSDQLDRPVQSDFQNNTKNNSLLDLLRVQSIHKVYHRQWTSSMHTLTFYKKLNIKDYQIAWFNFSLLYQMLSHYSPSTWPI